GHTPLALGEQFRAALAEAHGLAAARLHLADDEDPRRDDQQEREPIDQNADQRKAVAVVSLDRHADVVIVQLLHQRRIAGRLRGGELRVVLERALDLVALDGDRLHVAGDDLVVEVAVIHGGRRAVAARALEQIEQNNQNDGDDDPEREITKITQRGTLPRGWGGVASASLTEIGILIRSCQSGNR